MICNICGKENSNDAVFCKGCGNRLVPEQKPPETGTIRVEEIADESNAYTVSSGVDNNESGVIMCANCGTANPAGGAFCGKCGKPFVSVCPKCGSKLAEGQRFCGACGAAASQTNGTTLGDVAGKVADRVKNINLSAIGQKASGIKINYVTVLSGIMALCVLLCAVVSPWFSILGRSGGLFKMLDIGFNFSYYMNYYMMGDNGLGVIIIIVAGLVLLLCGVSVAAYIMALVNEIKGSGNADAKFDGACGFGAVAAIIALIVPPIANAVVENEIGFGINILSAEATPWGLLALCAVAFVLKKFIFGKLLKQPRD